MCVFLHHLSARVLEQLRNRGCVYNGTLPQQQLTAVHLFTEDPPLCPVWCVTALCGLWVCVLSGCLFFFFEVIQDQTLWFFLTFCTVTFGGAMLETMWFRLTLTQ